MVIVGRSAEVSGSVVLVARLVLELPVHQVVDPGFGVAAGIGAEDCWRGRRGAFRGAAGSRGRGGGRAATEAASRRSSYRRPRWRSGGGRREARSRYRPVFSTRRSRARLIPTGRSRMKYDDACAACGRARAPVQSGVGNALHWAGRPWPDPPRVFHAAGRMHRPAGGGSEPRQRREGTIGRGAGFVRDATGFQGPLDSR